MIIDVFVRARLLGLSLLTLEGRVVVGHEDGQRQVIRARPVYSVAEYPSTRPPELSAAPERAVPPVVGDPSWPGPSSCSNRARTRSPGAGAWRAG